MKKQMFRLSFMATVIAISFASCAPAPYVVAVKPSDPYAVRPVPPAYNHVWIDGEWVWRGNRYEYMHGYWATPKAGYRWIPGHWEAARGGWYWSPGHWQTGY